MLCLFLRLCCDNFLQIDVSILSRPLVRTKGKVSFDRLDSRFYWLFLFLEFTDRTTHSTECESPHSSAEKRGNVSLVISDTLFSFTLHLYYYYILVSIRDIIGLSESCAPEKRISAALTVRWLDQDSRTARGARVKCEYYWYYAWKIPSLFTSHV